MKTENYLKEVENENLKKHYTVEVNNDGVISRVYISAVKETDMIRELYRRYNDIAWYEVLDKSGRNYEIKSNQFLDDINEIDEELAA